MNEQPQSITVKIRQGVVQLPYLGKALGLVWQAARKWTLVWVVLLVVQGLLPVATVYLVRLVVDSLVAAMDGGGEWESVQPVLLYAGLLAGVLLATEVLGSVSGWVRAAQAELVHDHITGMVQEKSCAVDLAFYESPEYYDRMHRARAEALSRPLALTENVGGLLQNGLTLVAMAAVLIPYGWWLPVALLVSTLPAFWVVVRYAVRQYQWRMRVTEDERRVWYYDWVVRSRDTASELRLFDLGEHFREAYRVLRRRLRGERLRLARDQVVSQLVAGVFGLLVTAGAMAWMGWRVLSGPLTLGDLALFYQAFNKGQGLMRSLLSRVGQIYSDSLFLGNLFEFLGLEARVVDGEVVGHGAVVVGKEIRFRDVSFAYPGRQRPVLEGFDLVIPAGKVVAVVGANGAGKSTLFKLVCRLYDPDSGAVEVDGVDIRELSLDELRRAITVMFQEPVHYNATVAENIRMGDLGREGDGAGVEGAARDAGCHDMVAELPDGYETLLGRWFAGGTELSVGQWQRLALARAFLREAPLMLLDEPTSSMDSWAETEWMERFRSLAEGRTAVIITHRFTTARRADLIHVMDDGEIVESGTHVELVEAGGRYAEAWAAQVRGG